MDSIKTEEWKEQSHEGRGKEGLTEEGKKAGGKERRKGLGKRNKDKD